MTVPMSEWTWIQHDKYDWSIVDGEREVAHVEAEADTIEIIQKALDLAVRTSAQQEERP